jgi:hypothetical protein
VCCHSSLHLSYCAGQAGIEATQASSAQALLSSSSAAPAQQQQQQQEREKERSDDRKAEKVDQNYSKTRVGEGDVKLDQERLAQAIAEERKRKARGGKDDGERSSKKQKSSLESGSHEVTEEELGTNLFSSVSLPACLLTPFFVCFCRGLSYVKAYDGGSDGKLRRQRSIIVSPLAFLSGHCSIVSVVFFIICHSIYLL